jgi:hypothetical protein
MLNVVQQLCNPVSLRFMSIECVLHASQRVSSALQDVVALTRADRWSTSMRSKGQSDKILFRKAFGKGRVMAPGSSGVEYLYFSVLAIQMMKWC